MFGSVVLGIDTERYQEILTATRLRAGITSLPWLPSLHDFVSFIVAIKSVFL